ncbi:MAG: CDP-glycerol glycerophosphotransferase family protein [Actinoallomurus sp.]
MTRRWIRTAAGPALVLAYPATVVAALVPSAWAFAATALIAYAADELTSRETTGVTERLAQVNAGVTVRFLIRELALLLLLVRQGHASDAGFAILALGLLGLHCLRGAYSGLTLYVIRRRRLPVVTRDLDLSPLRIPDAPSPFLTTRHARTMLHLDVPVLAGALFGVWIGVGGLVLAYALGLAAAFVMVEHALRNRHLGNEDRVFDVVNERLAQLAPEVALYFSGSPDSAYQANMWLSTIDELDHPAVIILRERVMVPLLGRTSTPVLCVPKAMDMVRLDLSSIRTAVYPANVGKNLHMLRMSGIRSAFVNHGDSDKPASFNPFARAYDEVWVAGPAGRERYLTMRTGVRDEDIVEVGRPQLAPIDRSGGTPDPMFTVLYAPTWEGWSDDLAHSSVATMGPAIVRALLDHSPRIRVLYKPHPLTGTRDPLAIERHHEIVAMIEKANTKREASGNEFTDVLKSLTRRIEALAGDESAGDEAQISRDAGRPAFPDDRRDAEDTWVETYWKAGGTARHRVITGARPHVYDCFNHADLLITDISSVAGDFIVSGKPYAVTNVKGFDTEEFRRLFPTAAMAAYLIGPDCAELLGVVAQALSEGPDPMADRRRSLRTHLMGPDGLDSAKAFEAAVSALSAKSLIRTDDDRPAA